MNDKEDWDADGHIILYMLAMFIFLNIVVGLALWFMA